MGIGLLLKTLLAGLSLWGDKEKHKYIDRVLELQRIMHEEEDKPVGARDNDRLDRAERELCDISNVFASAVGTTGTGS